MTPGTHQADRETELTTIGPKPDQRIREPGTDKGLGAQLPTDAKPHEDKPAVPDRPVQFEVHPGDIICRYCGTPNDPSLTWCGSAASARRLVQTVVVQPGPWWRRIFQRKPSKATSMQAGERPKGLGKDGQQGPGLVRRVVPLLLIAALAFAVTSVIVVPSVRSGIGDVITDLRMRFLSTVSDIHPVKTEGEGVRKANDGAKAADNSTLSFWLADPRNGDPTVTSTFQGPFNLGGLVFHNGAIEAEFTKHWRAKTIELTFPGTDLPPLRRTLEDKLPPRRSRSTYATSGRSS